MTRSRLLLSAAVVALLVGARLVWSPGLLGHPGGEVYGHAWVQWWHADALPDWPSGPGAWLVTPRAWPVIDPLPTAIAAAISRIAGPTAGWNALILGGIMLAFWGGADLARRAGGDPLVGGIALALAPSLLGSTASGLTEDLAVGLAAMVLARVGDADWRQGALAGLLLGVLCWCGPLLAWMTGVAALGLGITALVQGRHRWAGLAAGVAAAAPLALPAALLQGERILGRGHRTGSFVEQFEPLWRLNPWRGVDLASFMVPGPVGLEDAIIRIHPGYLGWSLLGLAICGRFSRWWILLGCTVLLAPGPRLAWMGQPLGMNNPLVAALQSVPMGELVNHHGRFLLIGGVALSALASRGAARIPARWRLLAAGLVAADLAVLSPLQAPLPTTPHHPLPVSDCAAGACIDDLSAGGVLELPVAGPGIHFQRPLLQQAFHRRAILADPNRPGLPPSIARTETGRWLGSLAFEDPAPPPRDFRPPGGIAVLVSRDAGTTAQLEDVLGPPDLSRSGSAAWDVGMRPDGG